MTVPWRARARGRNLDQYMGRGPYANGPGGWASANLAPYLARPLAPSGAGFRGRNRDQ